MLVPARIDEPELLDCGYGSEEDVKASLAEITKMNRYFGGLHAFTHYLYPRLITNSGTVTIADLGTGSAAIPVMIARWARTHSRDVRIIGVDYSPRHLRCANVAGSPGISLLQADANALPFAQESVDFMISCLFLHHFSPERVIALLRAAYSCVRRGIIMTDIVRGHLPRLAYKLVQPIFARNFLTRHDGDTSIRRAYTPQELRELAERAGLANVKVYAHWPWRMILVIDK
jgi:ubiquinone/menaquinone biosynthesis C-methylase UbiE